MKKHKIHHSSYNTKIKNWKFYPKPPKNIFLGGLQTRAPTQKKIEGFIPLAPSIIDPYNFSEWLMTKFHNIYHYQNI